jgi:hypothetical protein
MQAQVGSYSLATLNAKGIQDKQNTQRLPPARPLISGLSNLILHVTSSAIDLKLTAPL